MENIEKVRSVCEILFSLHDPIDIERNIIPDFCFRSYIGTNDRLTNTRTIFCTTQFREFTLSYQGRTYDKISRYSLHCVADSMNSRYFNETHTESSDRIPNFHLFFNNIKYPSKKDIFAHMIQLSYMLILIEDHLSISMTQFLLYRYSWFKIIVFSTIYPNRFMESLILFWFVKTNG